MRHVFAAVLLLLGILVHAACSSPASRIHSFGNDHGDVATKGKTTKLIAVFEGGSAEIDHELGAVESGKPIETAPLNETTTFTLTLTKDSGGTDERKVTITVIEPPAITSFKADKVVLPGQETTLTGVFTGGKGTIDGGLGDVESGKPKSTGKLAETKNFTLTVTNDAGDTTTAVAEAEAAITPVITSFEAPGGPVASRHVPMELKAVFTGGHGTIDQGVGPITSGASAKTPKVPMAGGTYTLTVTNGLGEKVTKSVSVTTKKEMFVTDYDADILVYDVDAQGDVDPKRVMLTDGAKIDGIVSIVGDGDELFIANENGTTSVSVFDVTSEGPVKPKRRIAGPTTKIAGAYIISIFGGEMFVADKGASIKVFNTTDNGDVAPKRTIAGALTKLSNALATWVDGGELYVSNADNGGTASSITVYPVATTGNKAPTRTIPIATPTGLRVDANELFVAGLAGDVTVLNKKTGAKLRKIAGASTQLDSLFECSVADGELFCASYGSNKIVVFAENANGNAAPKRVLAGPKTLLEGPSGVWIY